MICIASQSVNYGGSNDKVLPGALLGRYISNILCTYKKFKLYLFQARYIVSMLFSISMNRDYIH